MRRGNGVRDGGPRGQTLFRGSLGAGAWLTAGALLSASSCAQVLGIEDARVDPSLLAGGAGGQLGAGTGGASGGQSMSGGRSGDDHDAALEGGTGGGVALDGGLGSEVEAGGFSAVCQQYCDDIMSYCRGPLRQYVDNAQCLKVCALFPPGTVDQAEDANTAACRLKYAGKAHYAAGSEQDAYCHKAGPGSDGTCGSTCDGFCTLMMPTCTAQKTPPFFFATEVDCMTTCRALRDNPPYSVSDGALPDRNDAQCRLFHVTSAVMDPDEHCEHSMGVTMCDQKPDAN
jgi:hypothetical protein